MKMKSLALAWAAVMLAGSASLAQAQSTSNAELYHVQFVKAAPGKLGALIDAYLKLPPDVNNPEPPVILRHAQGDDWQLLVISPLGKDEMVSATEQAAAVNQWTLQVRGLSARHGDTFTQGPPWAEAKKLLLGDNQQNGVYIVTTYEPVPGHRAELLKALQSGPQASPSTTLTLQHREGAPWQVLTIQRYASWSVLGEIMQKQRQQSPGVPPTADHIAAHHDTIAERVTAPVR